MAGGDTLIVRGAPTTNAFYDETLDNLNGTTIFPSGGGSFATATTIKAFPGETVWLKPTTSGGGFGQVINIDNASYIIFDGIRIDATIVNPAPTYNPSSCGIKTNNNTHHIRYTNGEIIGAGDNVQWSEGTGTTGFNEFTNSLNHDNGTPATATLPGHGFYVGCANNLVDHSKIYNIQSFGIHNYLATTGFPGLDNNVYSNNEVYNCNLNRQVGDGSGILYQASASGGGHNGLIYNNVVHDIQGFMSFGGAFGAGIQIGSVTNTGVYNNTVYNCGGDGITITGPGAHSTQIVNNILYLNANDTPDNAGPDPTPHIANNLSGVNPLFVNPNSPTYDFHLSSAGSPAISFGQNLSSLGITGLDVDKDGVQRPSNPAVNWDVGAFQFSSGPNVSDTVTTGESVTPHLRSFINVSE